MLLGKLDSPGEAFTRLDAEVSPVSEGSASEPLDSGNFSCNPNTCAAACTVVGR